MVKDQCCTETQMKALEYLGVDTTKASMLLQFQLNDEYVGMIVNDSTQSCNTTLDYFIPIFTLSDMLAILENRTEEDVIVDISGNSRMGYTCSLYYPSKKSF